MHFLLILVILSPFFQSGEMQNCQPPMNLALPTPPPLNQQIRRTHQQANRIVEGTVYVMPDRAYSDMMYIVVDHYFKGNGPSVVMVANEYNPCAGTAFWPGDHAVYFLRGQSLIQRFDANEQVNAAIQKQTGQEPRAIIHVDPRPLVILFGLVIFFPAVGILSLCYRFSRYR